MYSNYYSFIYQTFPNASFNMWMFPRQMDVQSIYPFNHKFKNIIIVCDFPWLFSQINLNSVIYISSSWQNITRWRGFLISPSCWAPFLTPQVLWSPGVDDERSWRRRDKLNGEQGQRHGQAGREGRPMLCQHGHLHQDGQYIVPNYQNAKFIPPWINPNNHSMDVCLTDKYQDWSG